MEGEKKKKKRVWPCVLKPKVPETHRLLVQLLGKKKFVARHGYEERDGWMEGWIHHDPATIKHAQHSRPHPHVFWGKATSCFGYFRGGT